jgi:hypothetical protein
MLLTANTPLQSLNNAVRREKVFRHNLVDKILIARQQGQDTTDIERQIDTKGEIIYICIKY